MLDECIVQSNRIEGEPDEDQLQLYRALFKRGPHGAVTLKFMLQAHQQLFRDRPETFPGHFRSDDEVPTAVKQVFCTTASGNTHIYLAPELIPEALDTLVENSQQRFWNLCKKMSPQDRHTQLIDYLAYFHYEFLAIHPFVDGNGRAARLFTWCIMKGFFKDPVKIVEEEYFELLERCNETGDYTILSPIFENVPKFEQKTVVESSSSSELDFDNI